MFNFRYDSKLSHYQYLPYLTYISKDLVDEFNSTILKTKFGFYQNQLSPDNYLITEKRYIDDDDRYKLYNEKYLSNSILYENISNEFINIIDYFKKLGDVRNKRLYEGYLYKIQNQIRQENIRLYKIIKKLNSIKLKRKDRSLLLKPKPKININIVLSFLFILVLIYFLLELNIR